MQSSTGQITGKSIIGYGRGADGAETLQGINPATGETLEPAFHAASAEELDAACLLAGECFPSYSRLSAIGRAAFLRKIAGNLEALGDALIDRAAEESGLPRARIQGERGRTCSQLRFFADVIEEGSWADARIDRADPARTPAPKPDVRSMLRPIGPVAVFCASNFPLAFSVAGGDTASALAAGNPVVVVAHHSHPGTAELAGAAIADAAHEMGMPEGVFSLLFAKGTHTGRALVQHAAIKAAGFTGSRTGGLALLKVAAERAEPIPFYAEMSSVNPVFLLPGAIAERGEQIAAGLHGSVTLGAGQFCTNPGVLVTVEGAGTGRLIQELTSRMAATPRAVMLNRGIQESYAKAVSARKEHAGVETLGHVKVDPAAAACEAGAAVFAVEAKTYLRDRELHEEVFGPSTLLVRCAGREELMDVARTMEGHLTATVHGTEADAGEFRELTAILETRVGRIVWNGYPTGVEVCHAMVHGGPYPATSDGRSTSVGGRAILRFARAVCYQDCPEAALPLELRNGNLLGVMRMVDGVLTRAAV